MVDLIRLPHNLTKCDNTHCFKISNELTAYFHSYSIYVFEDNANMYGSNTGLL